MPATHRRKGESKSRIPGQRLAWPPPELPRSVLRRAAKGREVRMVNEVTAAEQALEARERSRAERHRGSVVRRLYRAGRLSETQLNGLEIWASDFSASQAGVPSPLGRDDVGGGSGGEPTLVGTESFAYLRYQRARRALLEDENGMAVEMITHRVAIQNMSPSAAVADAIGRRCLTAGEAIDLVRAGADILDRHYRRRNDR